MSLLEHILGGIFWIGSAFSRWGFELQGNRDDDPVTSERRSLGKLWTISFATSIIVIAAAMFVSSILSDSSRSAVPEVMEMMRQAVVFALLAAMAWMLLVSAYCGYRVWRLERELY